MEKEKIDNKIITYTDVENIEIKSTLKVLSLFSGCGGMDLGFRGDFVFNNKTYEKNPFEIVFANDILEHACKTYEFNFKHKPYCGDIRDLDITQLPKADIVIGGFPCQDFSLAGKRKGLSAERGRLYLEMKKVIEYVKPMAFVAENVDGIRLSKNGEEKSALDIIIQDFKNVGYDVMYAPLNASNYGVPQSRIRVIIIGIRNDLNKKIFYPQPKYGNGFLNPVVTAKDAIDDLWDKIGITNIKNHTEKDYSKAKFYVGKKLQGNNQIKADSPSPTIRSEHHGNIEGHYRTRLPEDPTNILGWRRLSVRECARLQSFPDNFEFVGGASTAYKEVGNAVPPVLAWNVSRALYKSLTTLD